MSTRHKLAVAIITILHSLNFLSAESSKQISYEHKTELVLSTHQGLALPDTVEAYAKTQYGYLSDKDSPYFNTAFVRDVKAVRAHHTDLANPDHGTLASVRTDDGLEIPCTYFNRGKKSLVIVGAGFTNEREIMTPFVKMFENHDVLLFDFRGHGYEPARWNQPSTWMTLNCAKGTFGIDSRESMLGEVEELDVLAVVREARSTGKYDHIYGVSLCYGSFVFLKAEAMHPGLFDRIVVDGCWDSLDKVIVKMREDLKLLCKPQTGGWKDSWLLQQPWCQSMITFLARNVWALNIDHDVKLTDYLPKITQTPVLFFYGKNDLMVYRDEFEELWNTLTTPYKVAMITSNPHVMNQYKQKELYKHICETFFASNSVDVFKKSIFSSTNTQDPSIAITTESTATAAAAA